MPLLHILAFFFFGASSFCRSFSYFASSHLIPGFLAPCFSPPRTVRGRPRVCCLYQGSPRPLSPSSNTFFFRRSAFFWRVFFFRRGRLSLRVDDGILFVFFSLLCSCSINGITSTTLLPPSLLFARSWRLDPLLPSLFTPVDLPLFSPLEQDCAAAFEDRRYLP